MSGSTVVKSNAFTKPMIIRCAILSDRASAPRVRNETDGASFSGKSQGKDPRPDFQNLGARPRRWL
jgi:hypothetical protein